MACSCSCLLHSLCSTTQKKSRRSTKEVWWEQDNSSHETRTQTTCCRCARDAGCSASGNSGGGSGGCCTRCSQESTRARGEDCTVLTRIEGLQENIFGEITSRETEKTKLRHRGCNHTCGRISCLCRQTRTGVVGVGVYGSGSTTTTRLNSGSSNMARNHCGNAGRAND